VWELVGGGKVKERDYGEGIWLMDFIYLYETELKNLAVALSGVGKGLRGRDNGGNVNNVQYKSNRNCHYNPPYNEYIQIKNL
jgi:hypothetical protein